MTVHTYSKYPNYRGTPTTVRAFDLREGVRSPRARQRQRRAATQGTRRRYVYAMMRLQHKSANAFLAEAATLLLSTHVLALARPNNSIHQRIGCFNNMWTCLSDTGSSLGWEGLKTFCPRSLLSSQDIPRQLLHSGGGGGGRGGREGREPTP